MNKIDRLILELRIPPGDCYLKLCHTINEVNLIMKAAGSKEFVSPVLENVCFSSSLYGWSFTLLSFAQSYSNYHPSVNAHAFAKRLWGDLYFDQTDRKFKRNNSGNPENPRSFVEFILQPLYKIYSHVLGSNPEGIVFLCFFFFNGAKNKII